MSETTNSPLHLPPVHGFSEKRLQQHHHSFDRAVHDLQGRLKRLVARKVAVKRNPLIVAASREEKRLASLSDLRLSQEVAGLRQRLKRDRSMGQQAMGAGLAVLREVGRRTIGIRAHDVQLIGAQIVTNGKIAEMATGEGKTLVAAIAAGWQALTGMRVHVVTVNDYLAARDAEKLAPFFKFIGFEVGLVTGDTERADRARQYQRSICYCTNKELAFDYLRQRVRMGQQVTDLHSRVGAFVEGERGRTRQTIPGLQFAIIDEADSILVDEARTPLLLSEGKEDYLTADVIANIMAFASGLEVGRDAVPDPRAWTVRISNSVNSRLEEKFRKISRGPLSIPLLREDLLNQALMALHLYHLGTLSGPGRKGRNRRRIYGPSPAGPQLALRTSPDGRIQGRMRTDPCPCHSG
ncbi:DEAD/DEAH box helicase [Roseibium salinum]|uniref:DEAD/DEAH box helicase n=1 Tax=Roseibium salinum TaxID=1604349 RepID=UPI00360EB9B8